MSPFTKMMLDWEREKEKEKVEGREEGRREGILETAKRMIKRNMEIKDIQEITGLSKEELENMKGMLAKL